MRGSGGRVFQAAEAAIANVLRRHTWYVGEAGSRKPVWLEWTEGEED